MTRPRLSGFLITTLYLLATAAVASGDSLTIVSPVDFEDRKSVRDAVEAECELQTKVPAYIEAYARKHSSVRLAPDAKDSRGRVLRVTIAEVEESGPAGPKALTIDGELLENGRVIGTIRARRTSIGGPLVGFRGQCGILHRCAKALGRDVARWLEAPAMNVELMN